MSGSSTMMMNKTKLAISGTAAFVIAMFGLYIELFIAREVTEAPTVLFQAVARTEQRADKLSKHADSNWNEAVAKNKVRSQEYLERFNNDGFVSKEQEAYMEELAKEHKPAYVAMGFRGDLKKN